MKRCPLTYQPVISGLYSPEGLKQLSAKLTDLNILPYSREDFNREYVNRAGKLSIQGVQPKLSAVLKVTKQQFELVDIRGKFIIKPQNANYPELPQNEDITMKMAKMIGIETPWHGLIYSKNDDLNYVIKRFDRKGHSSKLALEDFAQLAQENRKTKYNSSMEKVVGIVDEFTTFPILEKLKLFKLTLFNFLVGNEDMHLKNFSLLTRNGKVEMSPTYDLLNTTIALQNPIEEIALTISGKKSKLRKKLFIDYLGSERMKLPTSRIGSVLEEIQEKEDLWQELISISFLSDDMKDRYFQLLENRWNRIFG